MDNMWRSENYAIINLGAESIVVNLDMEKFKLIDNAIIERGIEKAVRDNGYVYENPFPVQAASWSWNKSKVSWVAFDFDCDVQVSHDDKHGLISEGDFEILIDEIMEGNND